MTSHVLVTTSDIEISGSWSSGTASPSPARLWSSDGAGGHPTVGLSAMNDSLPDPPEIGDDPDQREWGMHMMLVARCLERVGDNAVDIGEQTAFVVTGLFRKFEDASHPELAPPTA